MMENLKNKVKGSVEFVKADFKRNPVNYAVIGIALYAYIVGSIWGWKTAQRRIERKIYKKFLKENDL